MPVDQKQAEAYVRDLLQKFEKDRDSLDSTQRRLILKYREAQARAEKTFQELEQLKNQIKQGEARVRSLELQVADAQGKSSGYLEFLVSMKFEEEPAVRPGFPTDKGPPEATEPAAIPPGNGDEVSGKKRIRALKAETQQPA